MSNLNVVISLTTRENDYQAEQSASAAEVASRLGVKISIIYADNDAVNQSQQLVKIIQDKIERPDAILVEPVGTPMSQVAKAAVGAGIAWGILNREADYIAELRRDTRIPVFAVSPDQEEVGRIQGRQLGAVATEGNVLYIEGPSSSSAASLRSKGILSTKPGGIAMKVLKGDWSERSAHHAVQAWSSLSTSKELHIQAVVCQNDAMAMGARKALVDLSAAECERWLNIPFLGCDGVTKTGQEWVRSGQLRATVVIPPMAGLALEMLAKAVSSGSMPAERTLCAPRSFPSFAEIGARTAGA
ncbi:MAG TPA: substrate-binding domain-containing protein [Candidatus Acidoferrum sp.]|jgi:ribose transport system substrate-binding protein|nr:substrate-binding domain-containing protein [Candidatus Acidoferrum sp.]